MFDFDKTPKPDKKGLQFQIFQDIKQSVKGMFKKEDSDNIDRDVEALSKLKPEELLEDCVKVAQAYKMAISACILLMESAKKNKPVPRAIIHTASTLCRVSIDDYMEKTHYARTTKD